LIMGRKDSPTSPRELKKKKKERTKRSGCVRSSAEKRQDQDYVLMNRRCLAGGERVGRGIQKGVSYNFWPERRESGNRSVSSALKGERGG